MNTWGSWLNIRLIKVVPERSAPKTTKLRLRSEESDVDAGFNGKLLRVLYVAAGLNLKSFFSKAVASYGVLLVISSIKSCIWRFSLVSTGTAIVICWMLWSSKTATVAIANPVITTISSRTPQRKCLIVCVSAFVGRSVKSRIWNVNISVLGSVVFLWVLFTSNIKTL